MGNPDLIVVGIVAIGLLIGFILAKWLLKLLASMMITAGLVVLLAFLTTIPAFNTVTKDIFVESHILANIKSVVFSDSV